MASEHFIRRYRKLYAKLVCLYPKRHRERFGEGMQQIFNDLCLETAKKGGGLFRLALWMFAETFVGIIRENLTVHIMKNKSIIRVAIGTGLILLIPFLGNLFVKGWNWSPGDFVIAGVFLFGTGLTFETLIRKSNTITYKVGVGIALLAALLLLWVNAAVEIIGDNNPANLMFLGVPIVGAIGAFIGRFEPRGMARALFAMAIAQALVPVIALIIWSPGVVSWSPGVLPVFGLNAFFVMLFVGSALLFQRASLKAAK